MQLYPAIDIRGGRCVRLSQGRDDVRTDYFNDPVEPAVRFARDGAEWIHVVDLDGAFGGEALNLPTLRRIASLGPKVQFGGGMRSVDAAAAAFDAGASRVVIGTRAATDPAFLREMAAAHGPRLAVGIDAKDGLVAVKGWTVVTALRATDFAREAGELGVSTIIYTDIATDGMLTGPDWKSLEDVLEACPCGVIASGGVSCSEDVARLAALSRRRPNLVGAIVGKAIYEGRCDVPALLKACKTA
ncbi:MAG: 1-(5-phosphoribosyl)-5-((5-phosphoribosylamino)methylideneamino)imidazole-4-carboxamide isomerase [Verrucomicrobia bacterium]|nr:1-(5-phosphoribosyl)-5-((5-phosphoribosylamino)methylideneamino)imidazole-4-carboxamide isomerase [Verrucomicrobiota bacterium]